VPEQYIFNQSAREVFEKKLEKLHDNYVYHLLMTGTAPIGTTLESVKMTKHGVAGQKYCERVVGGLVNLKPKIIVRLIEEYGLAAECLFTRIDDKESLNHIYMVQNIIHWPQLGNFNCQIWYLGETTMSQINEVWE